MRDDLSSSDGSPSVRKGMVHLVGVLGGETFAASPREALSAATVIAGSASNLKSVVAPPGARVSGLEPDLAGMLERFAREASRGERVCVLCSGDPGFFGLARLAAQVVPPDLLRVHPAPSSVSVAFARAGTNWEDAVVVSAHGRPDGAEAAAEAILRHPKVAALCGPGSPPQLIGSLAVKVGAGLREVLVGTALCEKGEKIWQGSLDELASGDFDPASVVVTTTPASASSKPNLRWGRPEEQFAHLRGMITKAEVRAVALSKLELPPAGVMWDVGAGSGSVSVEATAVAPGLSVYALERDPAQLRALRANTTGTGVRVLEGEAPGAFDALADPDRVFVGGGGIAVLDAALCRLRPGGRVVAVYASMSRALEGASRLGSMVQVSVSRAAPLGEDGSLRLRAENPVFVCWGPQGGTGQPR